MRKIIAFLFLAVVAAGYAGAPQGTHAQAIGIEPVIWTFGRDYTDSLPGDSRLPVTSVYIKTHDGDDWMSRWDSHPSAVSGPEKLNELIGSYGAQGIDVYAWFVPVGLDVDRQVELAEQVIDSGVRGLYADLEPFEGFCYQDCAYLAQNFWFRLRAERPNASLGVIYDPRTQWLGPPATAAWLSVADVALPMCYWESYDGQGAFGDAAGCVQQAWWDLQTLAPGRTLEYVPMLQGNSSPDRFVAALDAAAGLGAQRVSVWRRGVVPAEVWQAAAAYAGPITRPCWAHLEDDCYFREWSSPDVYVIEGGARFPIEAATTEQSSASVQVAPDGVAEHIPTVPKDGALLREAGHDEVYVIYGGGRFHVPNPEIFGAMGFGWDQVREVPASALKQVPVTPRDYTRASEFLTGGDWVIVGGAKMPVDDAVLTQLTTARKSDALYVLPTGALSAIPDVAPLSGDVDCRGGVNAVDALVMLQSAAALLHLALCFATSSDVDCDGDVDSVDALAVLRFVAGLPTDVAAACPGIGEPPTA